MTKIQKATLALIIAYIIWEISIRIWDPEANIRVDLVLIYPILIVLIVISLVQKFKK
jgi:branched-subunit amino acid permease